MDKDVRLAKMKELKLGAKLIEKPQKNERDILSLLPFLSAS